MSSVTPTKLIWRDGEFIRWEDATLHVMSHVVHYGSSVFEGIRSYETPDGSSVFRLNDHMKRLLDSCRVYRMALPYGEEELVSACIELLSRNDLKEGYIRPLVVRGEGAIGLHPGEASVHTFIICWPWGPYLGADAIESGIDACVSNWFRPGPNTHPSLAKLGGNYVNAQLIKMQATADGYAEGIALAPNGLVSEASGQNIFLVMGGRLITPPIDGSVLCGLTRDCILTLARDMGIPVAEEVIPREKLYLADEVFLTGTASEVTPVRSIDRIPVGNGRVGPITRRLQRRLLHIARGRTTDKYGWLTPIPGLQDANVANVWWDEVPVPQLGV